MLAAQAREAGCEAHVPADRARRPGPHRAPRSRAAAADCDLLIIVAGSSAGRDDYTARRRGRARHARRARRRGPARPPGRARRGRRHPGARRARLSGVRGADLRHLRRAAARRAGGRGAAPAAADHAPGWRASSPPRSGMDDWVRVRLGRGRAAPRSPRRCRAAPGVLTSLVRADGLLRRPGRARRGTRRASEVDVELLRGIDEIERTIVAIGSHDLVLDLAASALRADDPRSPWPRRTSARSAGWWRCATGCATSPARTCSTRPPASTRCPTSTGCCGERDVAVVRLVHRDQGLIVAPGNPLGLDGIGDLPGAGVRYVNRQRGAGTRVLLDHELARLGIGAGRGRRLRPGGARPTWRSPRRSPPAAPTRPGVLAAARAFGLDFVPVTREPYDLVVDASAMDGPCSPRCGHCSTDPGSGRRWRRWAVTAREMGQRVA